MKNLKELIAWSLLLIMMTTALGGCSPTPQKVKENIPSESAGEKSTESETNKNMEADEVTVETSAEEDSAKSENEGTDKENASVVIDNMGVKSKYDEIPERVVVLGYDAAELMVMLGLEDKIIALAPSMYRPEDMKPEYYKKIKDVPVLEDGKAPGVPTFETIISQEPDFVYGTFYSFSSDSAGALEDYQKQNINCYATEGTFLPNADIDTIYNDFLNIGKIFRIEEKAEAFVEDMKQRIRDVDNKLKDLTSKKVFVYDVQVKSGIMTAGGSGYQNNLILHAKADNIFADISEEFHTASIEDILDRNPDFIIFTEYYEQGEADGKIKHLESLKELKDVEAIKNKNYITISGYRYFPGTQCVEAIEELAQSIHGD